MYIDYFIFISNVNSLHLIYCRGQTHFYIIEISVNS